RPADEDDRVKAPGAQSIGNEPEKDPPGREGVAEPLFELAVPAVVQTDLGLELCGRERERLPVHVVQHGGQQEGPAHPPLPRRAVRAAHTSHSRPSHSTTRFRSATTACANDSKRPSPFSAVAYRG